jgi:hypothetical protein
VEIYRLEKELDAERRLERLWISPRAESGILSFPEYERL